MATEVSAAINYVISNKSETIKKYAENFTLDNSWADEDIIDTNKQIELVYQRIVQYLKKQDQFNLAYYINWANVCPEMSVIDYFRKTDFWEHSELDNLSDELFHIMVPLRNIAMRKFNSCEDVVHKTLQSYVESLASLMKNLFTDIPNYKAILIAEFGEDYH